MPNWRRCFLFVFRIFMPSLNKIELMGFLGRDPESRTFPSGDRLVTISLSTSSKWRDKQSGEMKESTEWHRVVFRGQIAEYVEKTFHKGSCIYVEGQMRYRKWQDEGGQERTMAEVHAYEVQSLDRRANDGAGNQRERRDQNEPSSGNADRRPQIPPKDQGSNQKIAMNGSDLDEDQLSKFEW